MESALRRIALAALLALPTAALATDNVLLIQMQPGGAYRVWHNAGETALSEEEVGEIEAAAVAGSTTAVTTAAGPARGENTADGLVIHLSGAPRDNLLLVDRDACGHVRLWHAAGATRLGDDQLTEIVMSALPEGGKRIRIGDYHVKAYLGRLGVTAALWDATKTKK